MSKKRHKAFAARPRRCCESQPAVYYEPQLCDEIFRLMKESALAITALIAETADGVINTAKELHAVFWENYRAIGTPYGETEIGLWNWLAEQANRNHIRHNA